LTSSDAVADDCTDNELVCNLPISTQVLLREVRKLCDEFEGNLKFECMCTDIPRNTSTLIGIGSILGRNSRSKMACLHV